MHSPPLTQPEFLGRVVGVPTTIPAPNSADEKGRESLRFKDSRPVPRQGLEPRTY